MKAQLNEVQTAAMLSAALAELQADPVANPQLSELLQGATVQQGYRQEAGDMVLEFVARGFVLLCHSVRAATGNNSDPSVVLKRQLLEQKRAGRRLGPMAGGMYAQGPVRAGVALQSLARGVPGAAVPTGCGRDGGESRWGRLWVSRGTTYAGQGSTYCAQPPHSVHNTFVRSMHVLCSRAHTMHDTHTHNSLLPTRHTVCARAFCHVLSTFRFLVSASNYCRRFFLPMPPLLLLLLLRAGKGAGWINFEDIPARAFCHVWHQPHGDGAQLCAGGNQAGAGTAGQVTM